MRAIDRFNLTGKSAFVTGAAQGIGKALALALAEAGADVAIVDINREKAEITAQEIKQATGRNVFAVGCDVTKPEEVENMVSTIVTAYGKLDIAIANAGIATHEPAEKMDYYKDWLSVINVNLNGVFLTDTVAGRQMLKQGYGSIINTASMSGHVVNVPQPQCSYNASKAGVILLTKSLAVEWSQKGVRVNCISPGYMATDLCVNDPQISPMIPQWNALTPMGRMGKVEELQCAALYLASDASTYTTGSDIIIDGAYSCV